MLDYGWSSLVIVLCIAYSTHCPFKCCLFHLHSLDFTQISNTNAIYKQKKPKGLFLVYVKLSTIMGFTWILGFVAAFTEIQELWYVFSIFNSLQGASVCVAFVFNHRVLLQYRALIKMFNQ